MNKKWVLKIFVAVLIVCFAVLLSSCGKDDDGGCSHNFESVTVDATCFKGGYVEKTCTLCGETVKENETEALGHSYDYGVCVRCDTPDHVSEGLEFRILDKLSACTNLSAASRTINEPILCPIR